MPWRYLHHLKEENNRLRARLMEVEEQLRVVTAKRLLENVLGRGQEQIAEPGGTTFLPEPLPGFCRSKRHLALLHGGEAGVLALAGMGVIARLAMYRVATASAVAAAVAVFYGVSPAHEAGPASPNPPMVQTAPAPATPTIPPAPSVTTTPIPPGGSDAPETATIAVPRPCDCDDAPETSPTPVIPLQRTKDDDKPAPKPGVNSPNLAASTNGVSPVIQDVEQAPALSTIDGSTLTRH